MRDGRKPYGEELSDLPAPAWLNAVLARRAAHRGLALDIPGRRPHDLSADEQARKILLGQRAR